ncbi:MAG: DUF3084 domain-containing protein [Synergistaceae bacterium]
MTELMKEVNWTLLLTLLVVSAVVAWAGDYIGMKLGKKRITFLKLRPKHTSRLMSVITGVLIAFVTLFAISVTVEPVRTALFSMNYVQNQITTLTADLQKNRSNLELMEVQLFESKGDLSEKQIMLQSVESKLQKETSNLEETKGKLKIIEEQMKKTEAEQAKLLWENSKLSDESKKLTESVASMKIESENLKQDMVRLREGRISALTGEVVAQVIIEEETKMDAESVKTLIKTLQDNTNSLLAYRLGEDKATLRDPIVDKQSLKKVTDILTKKKARWLTRMTVVSNAVSGEQLKVRVDVYPTKLIYNQGEVLVSKKVKQGQTKHDIEMVISLAFKELNMKAVKDGVFRDPITGNVGSLESDDLIKTMDKLLGIKEDKKLNFTTTRKIYSEGPVKVKCEIR